MVARTTSTSSTSLGSCPASDFVEMLGATRAETSGLVRCHGEVFKGDIRHN